MAPASDTSAFRNNLAIAINSGFAMACWRKPAEADMHILVTDSVKTLTNIKIEGLSEGFVVSPYGEPFNERGTEQVFYLPSTCYTSSADTISSVGFRASLDGLRPAKKIANTESLGQSIPNETTSQYYYDYVQKAVNEIQAGNYQKLVAARTKNVKLPLDFSIAEFFLNLCNAYPKAFVSLVRVPNYGVWVGASPELLVQLNKEGIFRTMALAGTQSRSGNSLAADAVWRQKDIEEQALVSRYIINCFKKIRLREFEEIGPRTVAAANLFHLRTDFKVDTLATQRPHLASDMLKLLHPTSAVCGMPREAAAQFVAKNEGFNRSLYAGFLGPVGYNSQVDIFVNLRCLQVVGHTAKVYAGAGLTGDSVPEREWQETEAKCQTLLNIL